MPVYEFRCKECRRISSGFWSVAEAPESMKCQHCGSAEAGRIISRIAVHKSELSKMAALDPKYDRMAEQALRNTPEGDPQRLLDRMTPYSAADD